MAWTPEAEKSFIDLKSQLSLVANLQCADFSLPFFLDVSETYTSAHGVLFQRSAETRQVLMYASVLLDPIEQRQPPCSRFVACLAKIICKTSYIVMNHPLTVID